MSTSSPSEGLDGNHHADNTVVPQDPSTAKEASSEDDQ